MKQFINAHMKKLLSALILCIAALVPVFGQEEYTIFYGGDIRGTVTIRQEKGGKITLASTITTNDWVLIDQALCPLIPAGKWEYEYINIGKKIPSVIIDGNTMTTTWSDGWWEKIVIVGNTTTRTYSSGSWEKKVIVGNTTTTNYSNGKWEKIVIVGNTTTRTYSDGSWSKEIVNGNTTTETSSSGWWRKTVVAGNTTTRTYSSGSWDKTVVDKQGKNIYITKTSGRS